MASPHYGEHFGLHWLDVARYADTAGFANDYSRPNAWRYRDYVVRAFNEDKPYDRFVREQVAGDEIDPKNPEHLIATGFLRMGPWEQTGMSVFKRHAAAVARRCDRLGRDRPSSPTPCSARSATTTSSIPVPTRDYYRMMAVFSTTQFADRERPLPRRAENKTGFAANPMHWVKAKMRRLRTQQAGGNSGQRIAKQTGRPRKPATQRPATTDLDPGDEASQSPDHQESLTRHQWELDRTQADRLLAVHTGKTIERKNVSTDGCPMPSQTRGAKGLPREGLLS